MLDINAEDAYIASVRKKQIHFPSVADPRYKALAAEKTGHLIPQVDPRFKIAKSDKIFTVGACFTFNIAKVLNDLGCTMVVDDYVAQHPELGDSLLTEYNPGTIKQRLNAAFGLFRYDDDAGIEAADPGFVDLFLFNGAPALERERLLERRSTIDALYKQVQGSDVVVVTLGLVEAWFDSQFNCYLNRAPSLGELRNAPYRYRFRRFDYADSLEMTDNIIRLLVKAGIGRILLNVSPIPMITTFSGKDAIVANSFSASMLRCVAEKLWETYPEVDYLPTYEMATSFGMVGSIQDNRHLTPFVLEEIRRLIQEKYLA